MDELRALEALVFPWIEGRVREEMAKAAADYGATVLLSNHSEFDDAYFKAHTAASRKAGEPNPFEVGTNGVASYFTVVQACTTAAKNRAVGQ